MANKTKQRIVTGLACTLPAVVAVPTLLTLAQCGNPTSTDHFELTGDVKKESTFATYKNEVVYQFTLKNVKDTRNIHVNLMNFKINGNTVKDEEKGLMYVHETSTSGILKIILYVDKIKAFTQSNDASTQYEVRFDVNLSSSEFNDTLTGFKLDLVYPEFDVVKTGSHITINGDDKVIYNPSVTDYYEYKLVADKHYNFNEDKVAVYRDGTALVKGSDYSIVTDSQTIKLQKKAITGKIEIRAEADAVQYDIAVTGDAAQASVFKNVPSKCPYGQDIDVDLVWNAGGTATIGKNLDLDSTSPTKFTVKVTEAGVGTTDITNQCSINNFHLTIPGKLITGQVAISCGLVDVPVKPTIIVPKDNATVTETTAADTGKAWADQTFKYILGNDTEAAKVKQSYQIKDVVATLTKYNTAGEVVSTRELHANELEVNRSSTLETGDKPWGTIKIPAAKYDGGEIKLEVITEKTAFTTSNYAKDSHIKFTNASDTGLFNNDLVVGFTVDTGYLFDLAQFNVLRTVDGRVDNITDACRPQVTETLNQFTIPAAQLQTRSGTLTVNAGTQLIKRDVTYGSDLTGVNFTAKPEKADIENDLVVGIELLPGWGNGSNLALKVERTKAAGGTDDITQGCTYDGHTLTVPKNEITNNIKITWTTPTVTANNVTIDKIKNVYASGFVNQAYVNAPYSATFVANAHYDLPEKITVNMGNSKLDESKYTWTQSTGALSIAAGIITDALDIEVVGVPHNYSITPPTTQIYTSGKPWLIWDNNNPTQLNIEGEYDIYFDVIAGVTLDETAFGISTGGSAMTKDNDYTLTPANGHNGNTRYHLHINAGAVKGAVTFPDGKIKMVNNKTEQYTPSLEVVGETYTESVQADTIASSTYLYYSNYGATITLKPGFTLNTSDIKVVDAEGKDVRATCTDKGSHQYGVDIAQEDTVPSDIKVTISPIRDTYEIDAAITGATITSRTEKASFNKDAVFDITNLPEGKEVLQDNLTVKVGNTTIAKTDYTLENNVLTIPAAKIVAKANFSDKVTITGATSTIQINVTKHLTNVTAPSISGPYNYGSLIEGTYICDQGKVFKSANVQIKVGDNWVDADPSLWSINNLGKIQILPGLVKQDILIIIVAE